MESRSLERSSILFVEDDRSCLEFGCYVLREAGHRVDPARNGREALELLSADRHWLVITDLRMPGVSGRDLVRMVRESIPRMRIIVVTASPLDSLVGRETFLGVFGFLKKPFSRLQLLKLVEEAQALLGNGYGRDLAR